MRLGYCLKGAALAVFALSSVAQAAILFDSGTTALTSGDPTQSGRLSRNGKIADWSSVESFPGVVNPATTYHFSTFVINSGVTPFIQVDFDSGTNLFASAYWTSYNPASMSTNYLGDEGSSGNFFGVDPAFFQVIVPAGMNLVVVVNNTGAMNLGVGDPFHLIVEGFIDTEFTDPAAVPEPASMLLGSLGLGCLALFRLRRKRDSGAS